MNYTVIWKPTAEAELAHIWNTAADRAAVTAAANAIDSLLQRDPSAQGESRSASSRVWFVEPLVVFFRVDEENRQVHVGRVQRARRP